MRQVHKDRSTHAPESCSRSRCIQDSHVLVDGLPIAAHSRAELDKPGPQLIKERQMTKHIPITAESLILALILAVREGDFYECQSLIEQGAYVDSRDEYGNSPLMLAVSSPKQLKLPRMFVKAGAGVNATNVLGETALFHAARSGNNGAVRLLVKSGADPNVVNRSGETALIVAAEKGHAGIVQVLLKHGADPDARNHKGVTALMKAAEQGNDDIVQALVDSDADVNTCDRNRETALMIAACWGYSKVVRTLARGGAACDFPNKDGWTALMFAEDLGQAEVADMLKMTSTSENEAVTSIAATSPAAAAFMA
jgi:ankyrin repeat protein